MHTDSSAETNGASALKRWVEQGFALLWIVGGGVVIVQSRELDYMSEFGPGPGFLPIWVAVAVIVLGFLLIAQVRFHREAAEDLSLPNAKSALEMFLVMAGYFGFVFLADKAGFLLSIGLLFLYLLAFVERRGWKYSVAAAICAVVIFWAVFELGLKMNLPSGVFNVLP